MLSYNEMWNCFSDIWEKRDHRHMDHSAKAWDERAAGWEKELKSDPVLIGRMRRRVEATVDFFLGRGLLGKDADVIDIGCGPGWFVNAFARHCHSVLGLDISGRMVKMGEESAGEQGIENVRYLCRDFKTPDLDLCDGGRCYDLVFASITPALNTPRMLDRVENLSRAFCFNSTFVKGSDPFAQAAMEYAVPGFRHSGAWDGRFLYAMFNLLWLRGRFPEVTYYRESDTEECPADRGMVDRITRRVPGDIATPEVKEKIYRYVADHADENGNIPYLTERWYGWLLWDVRDREPHDYFSSPPQAI